MLTLAINCCFSKLKEEFVPNTPHYYFHDSSATLLRDGKVLCASGEERFNRIKHTNKFCESSTRFCLDSSGVKLSDIDKIAFSFSEEFSNHELDKLCIGNTFSVKSPRQLLADLFQESFNYKLDPHSLVFISHHRAHAYAAFFHSEYPEALVLVVDGNGENESTSVFYGKGHQLCLLQTYPRHLSIGHFYLYSIRLLGYSLFDEYKVMGLAPYGNPKRYREVFKTLYSISDNGKFELDLANLQEKILSSGFVPRKKGEAFLQEHKDFAAALQETLEKLCFHILGTFQRKTGCNYLCMAGGVAHNCSFNGKLLRSGLFDEIFVHPCSSDAGITLGAALAAEHDVQQENFSPANLNHVYLGIETETSSDIEATLQSWDTFLDFSYSSNICRDAARLIAEGFVIGWMQGKAEFGPRALGNRSILADPRPEENKDRVNKLVKKREGYRPFAPSVLEEHAHEYFNLVGQLSKYKYMGFTMEVKPDKQPLLGAVTHIDGTARLQVVTKNSNKIYWRLINEFKEITGVPILLNTSFNNNFEPIVNNCQDAIRCFLTTGLDFIVIGNYVIKRKTKSIKSLLSMKIRLWDYVQVRQIKDSCDSSKKHRHHQIYFTYSGGRSQLISAQTYQIIQRSNDLKCLQKIFSEMALSDHLYEVVMDELYQLWESRFLDFYPF